MADMTVLNERLSLYRRLLAQIYEDEVALFQVLAEDELNESLWKGDPGARTGYSSFSELMHKEKLPEYHRLVAYKNCVAEFGIDTVRRIGIEQAKVLLSVPKEAPSLRVAGATARDAALQSALDSRDRNGAPPSPRQVQAFKQQQYAPPPKDSSAVPYKDRLVDTEHRLAEALKTIAAKDRKIAKLTKALAAAEAMLAKGPAKAKVRKAA